MSLHSSTFAGVTNVGHFTPPVAGAAFLAGLVASCLRCQRGTVRIRGVGAAFLAGLVASCLRCPRGTVRIRGVGAALLAGLVASCFRCQTVAVRIRGVESVVLLKCGVQEKNRKLDMHMAKYGETENKIAQETALRLQGSGLCKAENHNSAVEQGLPFFFLLPPSAFVCFPASDTSFRKRSGSSRSRCSLHCCRSWCYRWWRCRP